MCVCGVKMVIYKVGVEGGEGTAVGIGLLWQSNNPWRGKTVVAMASQGNKRKERKVCGATKVFLS